MAIKDRLASDIHFERMEPFAVVKYWTLVQQLLVESLSGQKAAPGYLVRLMGAIQDGSMQAWSALEKSVGNPKLVGMVFTLVSTDGMLGTKTLWIYGLTMRQQVAPEAYAKCLAAIESYARDQGCHAVKAQTEKHGVHSLLEANGFSNGAAILMKEI